jgi:hypothetical protein
MQSTRDPLDAALEGAKTTRRQILKRLLIASGALALVAPMSTIVAEAQEPEAKGKGKAKGSPSRRRAKAKGVAKARRRRSRRRAKGKPR